MTAVAAAAAVAGAGSASGVAGPRLVAPPSAGSLDAAGVERLRRAPWRRYRNAAGGPTVRVSTAYQDPKAIAERWTAFFESLVHGPELNVLDAYVAPLSELEAICGSTDVLGCYGNDRLVISNEGADGIAATSVAAHEYGHHVAFNRTNAPWNAVDWGPKRWATYERVCSRVAAGTAYPGAEDARYPLNPGEAWAETYRVLNETAAGLPFLWPIVDSSFEPDAGALAAARADVVDPWSPPSVSVRSLRFAKSARTWTMQVATPLDGALHVQVQPASDDVTLLASQGRTLARGIWSGPGARTLDYVVCGRRSVSLRIARHSSRRAFTLRVSVP